MLKEGKSITNYEPQSLIAKTVDYSPPPSSPPIFILCDRCYWCATYLDKTRTPQITHVPNVIVIIMNCLAFPSCLMNHSLLIMMIYME